MVTEKMRGYRRFHTQEWLWSSSLCKLSNSGDKCQCFVAIATYHVPMIGRRMKKQRPTFQSIGNSKDRPTMRGISFCGEGCGGTLVPEPVITEAIRGERFLLCYSYLHEARQHNQEASATGFGPFCLRTNAEAEIRARDGKPLFSKSEDLRFERDRGGMPERYRKRSQEKEPASRHSMTAGSRSSRKNWPRRPWRPA